MTGTAYLTQQELERKRRQEMNRIAALNAAINMAKVRECNTTRTICSYADSFYAWLEKDRL